MSKPAVKPLVVGFLSILEKAAEPPSWRGGYLLTNEFGRPLEFHYTTPVVLDAQRRALYGRRLQAVLATEILGWPLTERQTTAPRILFVDRPALLELRERIPAPIVQLTPTPSGLGAETHAAYASDRTAYEKILSRLPAGFDLMEPFGRIHVALEQLDNDGERSIA